MSDRVIPAELLQVQIAASDPHSSAWVTANAGSGKTYVLTRRVIRLLLDGNNPAKILCLTFTKAAAAHMANKVFETLGKWATMNDAALDAEILAVEGNRPSAARRLRARRLFAEALETPGGLKVQTIHAFCTSLLYQFPFEANVPVAFDVLDERAVSELFDRIRVAVMLEGAQAPDGPLGRAVAIAMTAAADITFVDVVREAVGERDAIDACLARVGTLEAAAAELSRLFGIDPAESLEKVNAEVCNSALFPPSAWEALAATLATGSKTDGTSAAFLRTALASHGGARCAQYENVFFKITDGEPRKDICTKTIQKKAPGLSERLAEEQARLSLLRLRRRAVIARDRSIALLTISKAIAERYRAEKERRGLLDYDDLIDKTLAVFTRVPSSWILYKLDLGIDHLLVDEAQDTSPKQWDVIRKLVEEFTAGAGARGALKRTIFAVGDEKQSIYSFQGAQPLLFDEMRRHFNAAHQASESDFATLPFKHSFRSTPDILRAVDTVFGRPEAYQGLSAENVHTLHEAVRGTAKGRIEIWEMIKPDEKAVVEGWDKPFDARTETSPPVKLAKKIAATIKGWMARGERVDGKPITPGDVLILVRARGALFQAVIRALKDARVKVAGADRLILTDHIAVMDLLSLADALLLPDDDLSLAEVLKSPLFGLSEEHLFDLAHGRSGSLRKALRAKAAAEPAFAEAAQQLDRLATAASQELPFAFYANVLGAHGGRKRMLARLGHEANEALDEFLALALDYERRETPSLQGFVAWMQAGQVEVKRDMDIVRDEVRVMTVHGAKGLEAPIVILADTIGDPKGPREPNLLSLPVPHTYAQAPGPLIWAGKKGDDIPVVATARAKARQATEDEHRRLLYVAMTRARDRLIVCGACGVKKTPEGCWYDLVFDALTPAAEKIEPVNGEGAIWVWRHSALDDVPQGMDREQAELPLSHDNAPWLHCDVLVTEGIAKPLSPSLAVAKRTAASPAHGSLHDGNGLARGRLVHRLLQSLPALSHEARSDAARRYLAKAAGAMPPSEADALMREVIVVLDHPDFAALFASGTRAEIPIVGQLSTTSGAPYLVSGQIDRLVVTDCEVLIADFKSDRAPPTVPPDHYVAQLALYCAVIRKLYPDRPIRASLVWTQIPRLDEIPENRLDFALASLAIRAP